jgi:hypothetical protein
MSRFLFLVLLLSSALQAQFTYREVLRLDWNEAGVRTAPDGRYGPQSFTVSGDSVFLLDTQNGRLSLFRANTRQWNRELPLNNAEDFILTPDNLILLSSNAVTRFDGNGNLISRDLFALRDFVTALFAGNNNQWLAEINQSETLNPQTGKVKQPGIVTTDNKRVSITYRSPETIHIELDNRRIATVAGASTGRFLGTDQSGNLFILLEFITQAVPLQVRREIRRYSASGDVLSTINVPVHQYAAVFREFRVGADGVLYHLITTESGVIIAGWFPDQSFTGQPETLTYPAELQSYDHYNSGLTDDLPAPEKNKSTDENRVFDTVTRTEALQIGDTYVLHNWTAAAGNLTNGRILDPDGVEIQTPSWVGVGQNQKVPYQWGGFYTLTSFDAGLLAGKYAGDNATTGVSSWCVGVDCSGFVSRCWKLSSHYSTRMMDDYITVAYSSWDELQPADAIHVVGHVRMFVDRNPNGTLLVVESSGADWRVSYRSYSLSSLSSYTPRYYIYMQGSPASIARPSLGMVQVGDSVRVQWQAASDTSGLAGYRVYVNQAHSGWAAVWGGYVFPMDQTAVSLAVNQGQETYFQVKSVSAANSDDESYPTDTYGYLSDNSGETVLIVDGFDRTDGSYPFPYHEFAMWMGEALAQYSINFVTTDNDEVVKGNVDLSEFGAVFWLLGDESTVDETFSDAEQELVKSYLRQGGKLFATGSEIAWDLDYRGGTSDLDFIHNFLKTSYEQDDSGSYTVNGVAGTPFEGLTLAYDDGTHGVYPEDWPDALSVSGGSQVVLKYANGLNAATYFSGMLSGGTANAQVMVMGFPFETIYLSGQRVQLVGDVLEQFGMIVSPVETVTDNAVPADYRLYANYPNPFNPVTTIRFDLPVAETVRISLFTVSGEKVGEIINGQFAAGNHQVQFDGRNLASGIYFYEMRAANFRNVQRMVLLK